MHSDLNQCLSLEKMIKMELREAVTQHDSMKLNLQILTQKHDNKLQEQVGQLCYYVAESSMASRRLTLA
mgnify:CR=1 FL=1